MGTAVRAQEEIRKIEAEIKRLQKEVEKLSTKYPRSSQFETLDTDMYLTEVYNG